MGYSEPMKAMILAAGLGTRLKPVTDRIPKALVEVNGATLLQQTLDHLKNYRINEVIVNVHHFAEQVRDYLDRHHDFGMEITISDESAELLDTGGGLKKASWFFKDGLPFVVHNVDVISDLDLDALQGYHLRSGAMATLVVRERETSRYLLFDDDMLLCGWENTITGEKRITGRKSEGLRRLAFSGIQIIDPELIDVVAMTGKFSLTEMYLRLSSEQKIAGFVDRESFWMDAGKTMSNEQ